MDLNFKFELIILAIKLFKISTYLFLNLVGRIFTNLDIKSLSEMFLQIKS